MGEIIGISTNDINILCLKRQTNTMQANGKYESNIHFQVNTKKKANQINIERVKGLLVCVL